MKRDAILVSPTSYGGSTKKDAEPAVIVPNTIRSVVAQLRADGFGTEFICFIKPEDAADLRSNSNPAQWREPGSFEERDYIYSYELGGFEGVEFIEISNIDNSYVLPVGYVQHWTKGFDLSYVYTGDGVRIGWKETMEFYTPDDDNVVFYAPDLSFFGEVTPSGKVTGRAKKPLIYALNTPHSSK